MIKYLGIEVQSLTKIDANLYARARDSFISEAKQHLDAFQPHKKKREATRSNNNALEFLDELEQKMTALARLHLKTSRHLDAFKKLQELPKDDIDGLLAGILPLLPDPGVRKEMGNEGLWIYLLDTAKEKNKEVKAKLNNKLALSEYIATHRDIFMINGGLPNDDAAWKKQIDQYNAAALHITAENIEEYLVLLRSVISDIKYKVNEVYLTGLAVGYLLDLHLLTSDFITTEQKTRKNLIEQTLADAIQKLFAAPDPNVALYEYSTNKNQQNCCLPLFKCMKLGWWHQRQLPEQARTPAPRLNKNGTRV